MAVKKCKEELSTDMERCIILLSKTVCVCLCVCVKIWMDIYQVFNNDYIWGKEQEF